MKVLLLIYINNGEKFIKLKYRELIVLKSSNKQPEIVYYMCTKNIYVKII